MATAFQSISHYYLLPFTVSAVTVSGTSKLRLTFKKPGPQLHRILQTTGGSTAFSVATAGTASSYSNLEITWTYNSGATASATNNSLSRSYTNHFGVDVYVTIKVIAGQVTQFGNGLLSWQGAEALKEVSTSDDSPYNNWALPGLTSLYGAFNGCSNLTTVPTYLPSDVTNTSYMFKGASTFNQNITGWDVTNVSKLNYMFSDATTFNQNIGPSWPIRLSQEINGITENSGTYNLTYASFTAYWHTKTVTGTNVTSLTTQQLDAETLVFDASCQTINLSGLGSVPAARTVIFEHNQNSNLDIRSNAFDGWTNLETVIMPYHYNNPNKNPLRNQTTGTSGPTYIFKDCTNLKNLVIPYAFCLWPGTGHYHFYNTALNSSDANIFLALDPVDSVGGSGDQILSGMRFVRYNTPVDSNLTSEDFTNSHFTFNPNYANAAFIENNISSIYMDDMKSFVPDLTTQVLRDSNYYSIDTFICFLGGTIVKTDQGDVSIEHVNVKEHTIHKKKIKAVTQTFYSLPEMVCIKKNALFKNSPSRDTYITQEHKIKYKGKMVTAKSLINSDTIIYHKVVRPLVYNIALYEQSVFCANNLIAETLDPENVLVYMALFMDSKNVSTEEKLAAYGTMSRIMDSEALDIRGGLVRELFSLFKKARRLNENAPRPPRIFKI